MKITRRILALSIACLLVLGLAACQKQPAAQSGDNPKDGELSASAAASILSQPPEEAGFDSILALTGKTDKEVVRVFGEGMPSTAEDGTLLGRSFLAETLGGSRNVDVVYGADGTVSLTTVMLTDTDFEGWGSALAHILGVEGVPQDSADTPDLPAGETLGGGDTDTEGAEVGGASKALLFETETHQVALTSAFGTLSIAISPAA